MFFLISKSMLLTFMLFIDIYVLLILLHFVPSKATEMRIVPKQQSNTCYPVLGLPMRYQPDCRNLFGRISWASMLY